ncbi:hypothetical protein DL93DRAFT_2232949 [Clavulina sp. PMI_390]|nr:hypothetical protein DL93DRAFT_2232949 [Clavulina sp. PMI_390]
MEALDKDLRRNIEIHNSKRPIFRLPDELLVQILEIAANDEQTLYQHIWSQPRFPFDIGPPDTADAFQSMNLVCRKIRSIALQSPRCWTNLLVGITNGDPNQHRDTYPSLEILGSLLSRSKSRLVNIIVYVLADLDEEERSIESFNPSNLLKAAAVIRPHLKRCRGISLIVHSDVGVRRISQHLREDAQWGSACVSLEQVMFYDPGSYARNTSWAVEPFWNRSSGQCDIKSLRIEGFTRFGRDVTIHSQLAGPGLRSLQMNSGLQNPALCSLLQQCPNLLHLHVRQAVARDLDSLIPLPEMRSLQSLTLQGDALFLFDPSHIAPSCERLILDDLSVPGSGYSIEMFRENSPTLYKLKVCQLYHLPDFDPMIRWLQRHVSIEQLAFTRPTPGPWGRRVESKMLSIILEKFISAHETEESFLPNLNYLAYELREEDELASVHARVDLVIDLITQLLSSCPSLRFRLFIRPRASGIRVEDGLGGLDALVDRLLEAGKQTKRFKVTTGKMVFLQEMNWDSLP